MSISTTVALLSGGIDSATVAAMAKEAGKKVIGLSFNYGQRHQNELKAASAIAKELKILDHKIVDINLASWGGSSLTDLSEKLPLQGIDKEGIPNTYVPGRNTVFIAIGLSLAEALGADQVALGINAVDYSGYPDCRPEYLHCFQELANLSSKAGIEDKAIELWAPLIYWKKSQIIQEAVRLKVPIQKTWSCYSDKSQPCGKCDSCRIRDQALFDAGLSALCSNSIA